MTEYTIDNGTLYEHELQTYANDSQRARRSYLQRKRVRTHRYSALNSITSYSPLLALVLPFSCLTVTA